MSISVPDAARAYRHEGLCVLPAKDNQKRPDVPSWTEYQNRLPTDAETARWFPSDRQRLCIVTGSVSGNVEAIDFDCAGEALNAWRESVLAEAPDLLGRLVIERTPSSGAHVFYRCAEAVQGNMKLAMRREEFSGPEEVIRFGKPVKPREDKPGSGRWYVDHVTIETRGEGGLILCAPTSGYEVIQGNLAALPVLSGSEREALICAARALNQVHAPAVPSPLPRGVDQRPGDAFNEHGDVRPVLQSHGWTLTKGGPNEHWSRPGKDSGTSATLRDGAFYVHSSNAAPFEPGKAYAGFAVVALLNHGGDYGAAARALWNQGYGERTSATVAAPSSGTASTPTKGAPKLRVQNFTDTIEETPTWIWEGYFPKKSTSVVGAKQGAGKGLCLADIAARASRGDVMPDGSPGSEAVRVLIVTREDDPAMALKPRLRVAGANMENIFWSNGDFGVGDDDGSRAAENMGQAAPLIEEAVIELGIGLVIIDPLGSWIEEDGNSAVQVRGVIDPMNRMAARTGCAVVFVAHVRKAPSDDPMDAFAGSFAVTAAVRVATVIAKLNDRESSWTVVKSNFRRPDKPMIWSMLPSEDPKDPPRVGWRTADQHDVAAAAHQAQRKAPMADPESVRRHMVEAHRPLKVEARRIHTLLMPTQRGLTVVSVKDAIAALVEAGAAYAGTGARGVSTIGLLPAMAPEAALDRAIAAWEQSPGATVREIAKIAGCSSSHADRARKMAMSPSSVPSPKDDQGDKGTKAGDNVSSPVPLLDARPIGARSQRWDGTSESGAACPAVVPSASDRSTKRRQKPTPTEDAFPAVPQDLTERTHVVPLELDPFTGKPGEE